MPSVGVSNKRRLVNLYLCALGPDGALKDTRFILVRVECPYVQSIAAYVISTEKWFVVGGTNSRERDISQVSDGKVERMSRAQLLLSYVLCVELIHPLVECPTLPFINQGGAGIIDG